MGIINSDRLFRVRPTQHPRVRQAQERRDPPHRREQEAEPEAPRLRRRAVVVRRAEAQAPPDVALRRRLARVVHVVRAPAVDRRRAGRHDRGQRDGQLREAPPLLLPSLACATR